MAVEEFQPINKKGGKKLPSRAKPRLPSERALKLYQKRVSKVTMHFVCGYIQRNQTVQACVASQEFMFDLFIGSS